METRQIKQVKAIDLQVGDRMTAFGEIVHVAPSVGIDTPSGKCDLCLIKANGKTRWATWNKSTMIAVKTN